jgi:hypothetical protein
VGSEETIKEDLLFKIPTQQAVAPALDGRKTLSLGNSAFTKSAVVSS